QVIQINQLGDYYVTVTFNGCVLSDVMNVGDDCPGRIFVPNVFSPNGDGLNDFFQVTYVNMETLTVKIYDRWGKFLFESNDKDFKWDGNFNGNPLPEGTFFWTINYKFTDIEFPEEKRGTVMILR
nr:gliding motility-associated C-terminal domain-containing protein [Bacteroidia bacterium]